MDPKEFFRTQTGLRRHEDHEIDIIPLRGLSDSDRFFLWFVRGLLIFDPPIEEEQYLRELLDKSNFMTLGTNAMRFFEAFSYSDDAQPEFERMMGNLGIRVTRSLE